MSLHLSPFMISILGCPWLPLPPCLPSSSPFIISILGCSWLPLPPCPPSFVFQPCLCSLLPLPPRLPSLFFGNAIWGLCRYNFFWGVAHIYIYNLYSQLYTRLRKSTLLEAALGELYPVEARLFVHSNEMQRYVILACKLGDI